MTTILIKDFDITDMKFGADLQTKEGQQISFVSLQMPVIRFPDAMTSTYGINPNFQDNDRFPLELLVTPETEQLISKIEDHIQKTFHDNSRTWFKKDKQSFKFSPLLKITDQGTVIKMKVVESRTTVKVFTDHGTVQKENGTLKSLNRLCKVLPFLSANSMWVNTTDHTYGVSLTAKIVVVQPGLEEDVVESMLLSAGYTFE